MAGGGTTNAPRLRKRVEAESSSSSALKRAKNGSAFAKCEECNKDVAVALIGFHNCSMDAQIKMKLESQVVEIPNDVEASKKPAAEKRKAKSSEPKPKPNKGKKAKSANAVKRPQTAFFLFMDDFRKSFKETNPDSKGAAKVSTEGGAKWRSMTDEEKKPYIDKAAELKAEYGKTIDAENEQDEVEEEKEVEEEEKVVEEEEKVVEEEEKVVEEEEKVDVEEKKVDVGEEKVVVEDE